jgi:hypothetical protein
MNMTPTQAALLRRGLDHLIENPGHVLESDFRRVVWTLAQMAARQSADTGNLPAAKRGGRNWWVDVHDLWLWMSERSS